MEINFLKKMAKTPKLADKYNVPITEPQIESIEKEIGKAFPISYREFLLLGGKGANMLADMDHRAFYSELIFWKERQENAKAAMEEENFSLPKDFWSFAELDGGDQFHFFYFDEGDDPPVYYYCSYHYDEQGKEYAGVIDLKRTFSEHINRQIDYRKDIGY